MEPISNLQHILWPYKYSNSDLRICGKCGDEVFGWVYDNHPGTDYGILCLGCEEEIKKQTSCSPKS